ncbi:hypothetical protein Mp_5g14800 [Marchantia polymorpha subsp. ruderalis]|uniref:Uncharacterized protein n=2 Tax=Marchantia polymorpha TaxID=3197 RepID=A0AAF6BIG1_MARPO|nr:hypothetical protein MARPO_0229s0010 [Marchantia polymorpha]BBN11795.1 hypothetical protein Mp_5g14800 [Marchantia polymorpha subsp. ruderalis]|eukprot:PTQ27063.1 hypothetical protein MARPO_0229s0010 [Marchantia polymorpha]
MDGRTEGERGGGLAGWREVGVVAQFLRGHGAAGSARGFVERLRGRLVAERGRGTSSVGRAGDEERGESKGNEREGGKQERRRPSLF